MSKNNDLKNLILELSEGQLTNTEIKLIADSIDPFLQGHEKGGTISISKLQEYVKNAVSYYHENRGSLNTLSAYKRKQSISHSLSEAVGDSRDSEPVNVIKQTCKELNINYEELGNIIGYSQAAIRKSASQNTPSKPMLKAIELYRENIRLKKQLSEFAQLQEQMKKFFSNSIENNEKL